MTQIATVKPLPRCLSLAMLWLCCNITPSVWAAASGDGVTADALVAETDMTAPCSVAPASAELPPAMPSAEALPEAHVVDAPTDAPTDAPATSQGLSLEAFKALQLQLMEQQFRLLDSNQDGYLDSEERSQGVLRLQQQLQQQIPSSVPAIPHP